MHRPLALPGIVLLGACALFAAASARAVDLHRLWDNRCGECHGHSGEFARKYLQVDGGALQGRHHKFNLRQFLDSHYPPPRQVDALYQMLMAQAATPPRFAELCAECHVSAADFMRQSLFLEQGVLTIRRNGQPVLTFMQSHRDLGEDDRRFFMRQLVRVAHEVYQP